MAEKLAQRDSVIDKFYCNYRGLKTHLFKQCGQSQMSNIENVGQTSNTSQFYEEFGAQSF